jgi:2-polyprenyl-3-methyl-5-hydroxy-6-metoxy-1,4-benzoquinol methylase
MQLPVARYRLPFAQVSRCPLCGSSAFIEEGMIDAHGYVSCNHCIEPVAEAQLDAVRLRRCRRCDLVFKDAVPTPDGLATFFALHGQAAWTSPYQFGPEVALIRRIFGDIPIRVLDVGPGQGGFLRAISSSASAVSAMDVVQFGSLKQIRARFLAGSIDGSFANWDSVPFDLVTLFDVIEHVYDARRTWDNLRTLIAPHGYLLIQTGNPESNLPTRHGLAHWWYLRSLEHHCAWSRKAIEYAAREHGFAIVEIRQHAHKDRWHGLTGLMPWTKALLRSLLYGLDKDMAKRVFSKLGYHSDQQQPLFEHDHNQVLLRRLR